jgi:hypothetical protein
MSLPGHKLSRHRSLGKSSPKRDDSIRWCRKPTTIYVRYQPWYNELREQKHTYYLLVLELDLSKEDSFFDIKCVLYEFLRRKLEFSCDRRIC